MTSELSRRSVEYRTETPRHSSRSPELAGVESKVMSFIMRMPIATFAPGKSGFARAKAARHSKGGIETVRRGKPQPVEDPADHLAVGERSRRRAAQ